MYNVYDFCEISKNQLNYSYFIKFNLINLYVRLLYYFFSKKKIQKNLFFILVLVLPLPCS